LQSGEFIPSQVLYAYAHYALEAQTQLNCIAEFLLESFEEAEILEREYSSTEKKPPLFGIPFSVKGNFYVCQTFFNTKNIFSS
jgi:fatty acid amide hydrolase